MFFKNAIFYRLTNSMAAGFADKLADKPFTPCGSQELSRAGWTAPTDLIDELSRAVSGATQICMLKEEKILPAPVIRQELDSKVKQIESEQARKVYRKEKDQLKDEIVIDLLPRAFSKFKKTHALILDSGWVIVDASSHKQAEEMLSHLRSLLGSLPVVLPDVNNSPSATMSHWLENPVDQPLGFNPLDESELKDSAIESGVIRCKGQDLESDEIIHHLEAGKRVTKLSLEWQEALTFTLSDDLVMKKIKLTDQLKESMDQSSTEDALERFDADLVQMQLEFDRLLPAIMDAFGGEAQR